MSITRDPERLARVANQLGEAVREAEQGGRVRLPVIQPSDAAGLVMVMHDELDQAIDERAAAAAAAGHHIACSAGCSSCCVAAVLVTEAEAVTVAQWLSEPENAATRAAFRSRYPAWRAALGSSINAIHEARTDAERRDAAIELKRKNVMCAFNRDGLCSIYPARPARCRTAHALETNAHCGATGDGKVQYFKHARTEMTFEEQEPMRGALHHALRPGAGIELLCAAVNRLLAGAVGRNDPCPCGSGQKYKRCCGR
jgi:Fe-S-cluster containining protein